MNICISNHLDNLSKLDPYSLRREEKRPIYLEVLTELTKHHYQSCPEYKNLMDKLGCDTAKFETVEHLPFLPVSLFKEYNLMSVQNDEVVQVLTSSGTSGSNLSRIYLDRLNATGQKRALTNIVADKTGKTRLPMLIIDSKESVKQRKSFSGRGAGIAGFSFLGKDITYVLDEDMNLDHQALDAFCERNSGKKILLFGFTYMVWQYFCNALMKTGHSYQLAGSVLIHGGGWKKLHENSVSNDVFRNMVKEVLGVEKVVNYYGMVEQTGSIFLECDAGYYHCSNYSDVITRDENFSACQYGESGIMQLISPLATSYPGHSILSEDAGVIMGEDDCVCGKNGKYFSINGRLQHSELRGCSDTYPGR